MSNIILDINKVSQWFPTKIGGRPLRVLHDVNIKVAQGQFLALVGASGCGKSTLLRAILGTVSQKGGEVQVDGKDVKGPNRDVGIVYQHYNLYDFLTAEKNVAVGPKWDETSTLYRTCRPVSWYVLRQFHLWEARDLLIKFKLRDVLGHYPSKLSGGQKQRVAIAQALIMKPRILLLDEPFGALDEATREQLQTMLLTLYQENLEAKKKGEDPPWTVVIITHELDEALYVSDRIVGLSKNWENKETEYMPHSQGTTEMTTWWQGDHSGATKVYDKATPIFHPDDPRDFDVFRDMKNEIRQVVLGEGKLGPVHPDEHVTFWDDAEDLVGKGVIVGGEHGK